MQKRRAAISMIFIAVILLSGVFWTGYEKSMKKPLFLLRKNSYAAVREHIHVFGGDASENMTLIISGSDAAIIDTGCVLADNSEHRSVNRLKKLIDEKQLDVRNIIYTHYHLDHISNTAKFISNESKGSVEFYDPLNTTDGQIIKMGTCVFRILHTPGHAGSRGGHISIELPGENILVAGDVLYTNFIPCMQYEDSPRAYMETLKRIGEEKYSLIIPGHGNILNTAYTVKRPMAYMKRLEKQVKRVIASGGDLAEARRRIKLEACYTDGEGMNLKDPIQKEFHRDNIRQMFAELTGESLGEPEGMIRP